MDPANLLRYFGQMLVVVASAEIGLRAIRPASPRVRLAFWRLVIAVCLLLPLLPLFPLLARLPALSLPWLPFGRIVSPGPASSVAAALDLSALARLARLPIADAAARQAMMTLLPLVPWIVLAGIIARAAWLGLGFLGLRRLRTGSRAADVSADIHALRARLAPHAALRCHDTVTQPVTFGLLRPIILLPPRVADLPRDAQRAIVCHELLHVARRDWAWTLIDEAVRTALWWHPAIWWALAQVHLQREQTIDARVVAITAARQPYMRALMLFADAPIAAAAHAALPFIRRRHLAARLRQLAQEVSMSSLSRFRLTCAITALTTILAGASWISISALPLHAQTQEPDKPPVRLTGEHPPKLVTKVNPEYPEDAKADRVEGAVGLEMRIAKDGTVADAKIVKSIPRLDKACLDAARKWKFEPVVIDDEPVEALVTVVMRFKLQ